MTINDPILPFPADIDREHFASWLSGFVDGEASFNMMIRHDNRLTENKDRRTGVCTFQIKLRADELGTAKLIQSFWKCGKIYVMNRHKTHPYNARPSCHFHVVDCINQSRILIPHFEKYPLIAKKKRDFKIWKLGVELCCKVTVRRRARPGRVGLCIKWTDADREYFASLKQTLEAQREYENSDIIIPAPINDHPPNESQSMLF